MGRPSSLRVVVAVPIVISVLVFGAPAVAGTTKASTHDRAKHGSARGSRVISVDMTTDGGFALPASVHAGLVTFRVTAADGTFHAFQGFSLNRGATLEQALADYNETLSGEPSRVAAGTRALARDVTQVGGVATSTGAAQEVTIPLKKGIYYFMDLDDVGVVAPRVHRLRAHGSSFKASPKCSRLTSRARARTCCAARSRSPRPCLDYSAKFKAAMVDNQPRFTGPTTIAHDATFLAVVTGDQAQQFVFRPVRPGITDEYITTFYDAIKSGTPRPPSPWTGLQTGLQTLSPGRYAIMHLDLPPGRYALISYAPSDESGFPHGWEGMHQIVTLN